MTAPAPLPLPDDPRIPELLAAWPDFQRTYPYPKATWLGALAAPFPLAKPGVP